MTGIEKVYRFICETYGECPFTTEQIYAQADLIGIKKGSIAGALQQLKKKGILTNYGGRITSNGHKQKVWELVRYEEER